MSKKSIIKPLTNYSDPVELEVQENLNRDLLKQLIPSRVNPIISSRPTANFIDLMNWTLDSFKDALKDQYNINKFVQNRIIIDGQFVQFCRENSIKIDCLYKDSIISWKTEHEYEKFFVQGVFLIKGQNFEFIHAALFHKGNQSEDEISFFVLVPESSYEEYIKLRNKFDNWIQQRDRGNLQIRVIDGDDIPYTKEHTWEDLFLPKDIKNEISGLVESFLSSKDFYQQNKIPWKRGILLYGKPGNGKTSIIRTIISVYNFKPVTIVPETNNDGVREAFAYAEEQSPSLLYFEDLDSLLEKVDISSFLNLMDGISAQNGLLVIATANDVKKLKKNITDRPSRFDRKFEIPLPTQEMAYIYLNRWFGKLISVAKGRELAKYAVDNDFSYAYLKELYISAMFEALSHNRKAPSSSDIDSAISSLVKDKNLLNNENSIRTDKYFNKK